MSKDNDIVTFKKFNEWMDDVESTLKTTIVNTGLDEAKTREELYHLYHAVQLLRTRASSELYKEVEVSNNMYDE